MGLKLRQVNDNICFHHVFSNQVAVCSGCMRFGHYSRIITGHSKGIVNTSNRLQQAFSPQIKQLKSLLRKNILLGNPHAVYVFAGSSSEVLEALKSRVGTHEVVSPNINTRRFQELNKMAALDRGIANQYFRRIGLQSRLYDRLDDS